jgi:hypothetical protein
VLNVNENFVAAGSIHRGLRLRTVGWSTLVGELEVRTPFDVQHFISTGEVLQSLLSLDFGVAFLDWSVGRSRHHVVNGSAAMEDVRALSTPGIVLPAVAERRIVFRYIT